MENRTIPQSQSNQEHRDRKTDTRLEEGDLSRPTTDVSLPARQVRRFDDDANHDVLPVEPGPREIETGANEEALLFQSYTGQKIPPGTMDETTRRILYELHTKRKGWTEALEDDARASLQLVYPDVAGSREHGPL